MLGNRSILSLYTISLGAFDIQRGNLTLDPGLDSGLDYGMDYGLIFGLRFGLDLMCYHSRSMAFITVFEHLKKATMTGLQIGASLL